MRTLVVTSAILPFIALGQCTLTATAGLNGVCNMVAGGYPAIGLSVNISGGTAPWTILLGTTPGTWTTTSPSFGVIFHTAACEDIAEDLLDPYYVQVTDALGCQALVGNAQITRGCWATRMNLGGLTRELVAEADNTTTLIFRYPQVQAGCYTNGALSNAPNWFSGLSYSLLRNGAAFASGAVSGIYQCPAPCSTNDRRLVFPHLPVGDYSISFSSTGSCSSYSPPNWCQSSVSAYSIFVPNTSDAGVNVRVGAALGGALLTNGVMQDSLRTHGLVPLTEPYAAAGYSYTGTAPGAGIAPALLSTTGNTAVVDWVVVELHSSASPYAVVASRPALIRRDGEVIDLDGDAYVNFPGLAAGNYRVALRHRNHLGVMTNSALALGFLPVRADFRTGVAYGSSPQTSIAGVQCLWAGDCAPEGTIRYVGANNDRDPILTAIGGSTPTNVVSNVYSPMDVNMDGSVKYVGTNNDRDPILTTVGGTVPTATRVQQLP